MAALVVVHHGMVSFVVLPGTGKWKLPDSVFYTETAIVPVLVFFFLTGFLFWTKLLEQPRPEPWHFLKARFRRLAPVYYACLAIFFGAVALATHFHRVVSAGTLFGSSLYWLTFTICGSPDVNAYPNTYYLIAGTPWTLAIEWEFYISLLFLSWFAKRWYRAVFLVALAIGTSLSLDWRYMSIARRLPLSQLWLHSFQIFVGHLGWSFGVGILVATARHVWPVFGWARTRPADCLAAVLLVACFIGPYTRYNFDTSLSLEAGAAFLLIAYGNDLFGSLRSKSVMTLGRFSYSLYLSHGLVLAAARFLRFHITGSKGSMPTLKAWPTIAAATVGCVLVGVLCHEFVEAPFMNRYGTTHPAARS